MLLPWMLGIAALLALRDARRPLAAPGEIAWILGVGYVVGAFLLTLWMRVLSAVGVPFGIAAIALPLLAVTLGLAYAGLRRRDAPPSAASRALATALGTPAEIGGRLKVLWWALVGWMALRFALLGYEVALQPLYPWDAWIEWATKARVWFESGRITPFVDAVQWLAPGGNAWFDASPENPATLPLLQVWTCVVLGRWDDSLMNWPWWQFALALVLLTYGGLRRLGTGALAALLGAYFAASLPLANVHVALAGYADLPLATVYAAAVLAFLCWDAARASREAILAVALLAMLPLIKSTGALYALTLLPGVVVALAPRLGGRAVATAFGLVAFGLAVLAQTSFVVGGRSLHLDFAPAWTALVEDYFVTASWNLLWYGVVGVAILAARQLRTPQLLPVTTIATAAMLIVLTLFAFPGIAAFMTDPPTVNRATLHVAPLLVVFAILAFRAFAEKWRTANPPPPPTAPPAPPEPPPPPEASAPPASAESSTPPPAAA